jgi:hypothetical protein
MKNEFANRQKMHLTIIGLQKALRKANDFLQEPGLPRLPSAESKCRGGTPEFPPGRLSGRINRPATGGRPA